MNLPAQWPALVAASRTARQLAYAPYSRYQVGAAALGSDGTIFTGCNVENASYGLTICAERVAVCTAVAAGQQALKAVCISLSGVPVPCGACRQFLFEFNPDMAILLDNLQGEPEQPPECILLSDLLPRGFRLAKTDRPGSLG
ncbi:MAG: cytidine deaminase [Fuerstiella sp.]